MKLNAEQTAAIAAFCKAVSNAIMDADISAEREDLQRLGLNLCDIEIQVSMRSAEEQPQPAAQSDADFLRSLRIAPDLEAK